MDKLRIVLLAGGRGVRMGELGRERPKPLIPHAGTCHLIDFSINNAFLSGSKEVLLLSQFEEKKLVRYLLDTWCGEAFRMHFSFYNEVFNENLEEVFARVKRPQEFGTADALIKNGEFIFIDPYTDVMVLHGDHVYNFDYREMLKFHRKSGAALTIGYQEIDIKYVPLFGMVKLDGDDNLLEFVEKPTQPECSTIFTAVCIFKAETLLYYLKLLENTDWKHDISHDVIPKMIQKGERVKGYPFMDYWEDIGTVERYYRANMNLLCNNPALCRSTTPTTLYKDVPRRFVESNGAIRSSVIAENACCDGEIENSIIYPNVHISKESVVKNSILLPGACVTGESSIIDSIVLEDMIVENQNLECFLNK
jgi:valienol-1-phosphate guanylyltransferase